MATLALSFNWASMALGSPESWPQNLRSALAKPRSIGLAGDISERKRTQEELQGKAEELDRYFTLAQDLLCIAGFDGYFLRLNPAWEQTLGYTIEELQKRPFLDFVHPDDVASTKEAVASLVSQREVRNFVNRYRCKDGSYRWIEWQGCGAEDRIYAAARDITEYKRQETERLSHLRYFKSMDRVNLAIQGAADLEQMMESVLDAVLDVFNCDRAALVCPCDPESPAWCVPMERTRPNYPGARARDAGDIPITPYVAETFRILRAADGPVKFGARTVGEVSDEYQIRSWISMAIYPKCGKPWQFLLHQCSYERVWAPEDERLFQEIGRRISDALSSLLFYRDLSKKEQKYREIFGNVSDCLTLYDIAPDGRLLLADMNPCAERIMGISKSEAVGLFFEDTVPNEMAARDLPLCRRCLETGEPLTFDEDLKLAPGIRSLHTTLLPVRNQSGSVYRLIVLNRDITERKAYEQQLRLLMREVNHRTKNLLSVVQAVVRHTAGEEDPKQFEERLRERIAALAANHDLLVNSEWRGVGMGKLAAAQLAHFGDLLGSRIVFGGPPVLLTPEASQTIGMALHELATNASKYGALSRGKGSIRIEWNIASEDEGPFFTIRWSEHGGPPPKPPQRHGFGHEVMVELAEYTLDAKVSLTYPSSGLVWELTAPAAVAIQPALSGLTESSIV